MPSWSKVLREVEESAQARNGAPDFDGIRGAYLEKISALTGRAVIAYGAGWLQQKGIPGQEVSYSMEGADVHALMEVCHGVASRELDLIIHSPGGSPEAAEQMLNYLRTQFDRIRALVPLQAKSAATMMALGCDEIVMGLHSELGPIDPQLIMAIGDSRRPAPAHAILRDFRRAQSQLAGNAQLLPAWTPILRTYGGGLLEVCNQAIQLSQDVVAGWLERYMLATPEAAVPEAERAGRAREIAEYFGSEDSYDRFRTHGRPIRLEELEGIPGLVVGHLEDDDALQDAVLSYYHALDLTFQGPALKIVENHQGRRFVRVIRALPAQLPIVPPGTAP